MNKGIDCATPLTSKTAKLIAATGYQFAARYLVPSSYAWKRLTRSEAEAITQSGMHIVSVFEAGADRPANAGPAGEKDGATAFYEARLIGQPVGSAIYFAVDFDAQPKHYDAIEEYLRHASAEITGYAVGVYGSYAVVEEMAKRIPGIKTWQTYAWSRGKKSALANIYQHLNGQVVAGVGVDFNESYSNEGWWNTKPAQEVKPKMSEDDENKIIMFLSASYGATTDPEARREFNRLANELRKASGQQVQ